MLDFLGIIILLLFFIRGYMKGVIVAVFSLLSILLGIICSLKLSGMLASYLLEKGWVNSGWAQAVSYAILFTVVLLVVRLIAKAIKSSMQLVMLGWADGFIGGLLYAFTAAVIWSSALWVGDKMHLINESTKLQSKTYEYFIVLAPWVVAHIGVLLPFAKDAFSELGYFFDKVNSHVPAP
jgi:membrane protein required for colicin V production